MLNLNQVVLAGRVGSDPEVRYIPDTKVCVTKFRLATSEYYKDKEGKRQEVTEWHSVVFKGPTAENAGRLVKKGSLIYVTGKNVTRTWETKDGKKYAHEVMCDSFQLIGPKPDQKPDSEQPSSAQNEGRNTSSGDYPEFDPQQF